MHYYQVTKSIMKPIESPIDSLSLGKRYKMDMPHAAYPIVIVHLSLKIN